MEHIDVSTEENKHKVYELFSSFSSKSEIYQYFGMSDNGANINYVNQIAKEVGFNFNYYKEKKKKFCLNCGKELKRGQSKFCCQSCAATYNNKRRKRKHKEKESKKEIKKEKKVIIPLRAKKRQAREKRLCGVCGKELNRRQEKFCSNECYQIYKTEATINKWLNTGQCGKKCDGTIPSVIKRFLLEKNSYKCQKCGFEGYNRATGKSILQFHHIDGDAYNNSIDNIEVICPNCHAMTENFMNLNKGKSTRTNRYKKESNAQR